MAPASPVASDAASDSSKTKKKSPSKSKKEESEVEDSEQSGEEAGEEDEEYEIEAILDAKKGHFPKNKLGYLVKWKGYSDEHNSWVIEEDAANADELIKAFWAEQKNKSSKKAPEPAKRARKSVAADDASDAGGSASASVAKKRGRKSSVKAPDAKDEDDERPPKKPRKSSEKKTPVPAAESADALPEDDEIGNMAQHMHAPTWDQLIKHIDTVERVSDETPGRLWVYFTAAQRRAHQRGL
ncbi:hypothetical protein FB451DRAFT_102059 [Mycena latifolia]|nr:hypothetical protein FB451DRAFT_102059 [Mycena latifolia]